MYKLVLFDASKTIFKGSVLRKILEIYGGEELAEKYDDIMRRFKNNEIGPKKRIDEIYLLYDGFPVKKLQEVYDHLINEFNEGAKECFGELKKRGIPYALLSNGPDVLWLKYFMKQFDFVYVLGNKGEVVDGKFTGKINRYANKEDGAKEIMQKLNVGSGECLVVEDSRSTMTDLVGKENCMAFSEEEVDFADQNITRLLDIIRIIDSKNSQDLINDLEEFQGKIAKSKSPREIEFHSKPGRSYAIGADGVIVKTWDPSEEFPVYPQETVTLEEFVKKYVKPEDVIGFSRELSEIKI